MTGAGDDPDRPASNTRQPPPAIAEDPGGYTDTPRSTRGDLADRIEFLANEMGRARLATTAEVSETQIFRYIARKNEPRTSVMLRIADGAGVNADWLLTGRGPMRADDRRYALDIDGALLARILTGVETLTDSSGERMDAETRADFAVSVYRHAMRTIADEEQRAEMVAGFIDVLHPLFGKKP